VDRALEALSPRFAKLYSLTGRPSIPPEKLLRALLLQAFFTVRSERRRPARRAESLRPNVSYTLSQCARKRIEEAFGWIKTIGGLRKT
jgi:hypothetical protein